MWGTGVHENHFSSTLVVPSVKALIEKLSDLAPLHNHSNLQGIQSIESLLGECHKLLFLTRFHQTIPLCSSLPYTLSLLSTAPYQKVWFHGTSHSYVSTRAAEILDCSIGSLKIISCHLVVEQVSQLMVDCLLYKYGNHSFSRA